MASKARQLSVPRRHDGDALLDFLAQALDLSRRAAKRLLDERRVIVNGKRVWMARHRLHAADTVAVTPPGTQAPASPDRLPRILFEDEHLLIVNKPPGRLAVGKQSIESALQTEGSRPGIIAAHRLDRDTSGCMLFLKTPALRNRVIDLFKTHKVHKQYHAIVAGRLKEGEARVRKPLDGRSAVTMLRSLDTGRHATHVLARIETGRTHQIRRHLASLGHPVIGDKQYTRRDAVSETLIETPRHMLHAFKLELPHPVTKRNVSACAPLPRDFKTCLHRLKLT